MGIGELKREISVRNKVNQMEPESNKNMSDEVKYETKGSSKELKEEYDFEEGYIFKDELENDSSQGEEESQYEAKYLEEIELLRKEYQISEAKQVDYATATDTKKSPLKVMLPDNKTDLPSIRP